MAFRNPLAHLFLTALAGLSLLTGCGTAPMAVPTSGSLVDQSILAAKSRDSGLSLVVMPDAGPDFLLKAIQGAKKSITLEMYLLTYTGITQQITDALIAKSKAGLDVRIILENQPFIMPTPPKPGEPPKPPINVNRAAFEALTAGGVRVKRSSPQFAFTHEKCMVIDQKVAYIMTMNFSNAALQKNREYVVIDESPSDVAELNRIFQADWDETPIVPKDPDLVVSPSNSKERILTLINSAQKSLAVQVEFIDDADVVAALASRQKAGVELTMQLSYQRPEGDNDSNARELQQLNAAGITKIKFIKTLGLHAKLIVADNAKAYVGSENFTTNSLTRNREMGIIVKDQTIVSKLAEIAAKDWAAN
ncbi:MAG TPA: phospholipase D-like domain-containing protein [Stenomitos sp.]